MNRCVGLRIAPNSICGTLLNGEFSAGQLQDCVRAMSGPRRFLGFGETVSSTIDV